MATQYTAKIPFNRIIKMGMWNNQTNRQTLNTVYNTLVNKYPGKEVYICNGGFFNMTSNWTPVWGLRCAGITLGNTWGGNPFMAMKDKTMKYYPPGNYLISEYPDGVTGYPALIENGVKSKYFHNGPDGTSNRGRTMLGYTDNAVVVSVIGDISGSSDFTLTEELNYMLSQGCKYAINLDGGGSSQCNFNGKKINSSRKVHNMFYIVAEPDTSGNPKKLYQAWLNSTYKSGLVIDGSLGNATKKATIKGMQKEIGVTADGSWGSKSKNAYKYLALNGPNNTPNKVKLLQGALMRKGYWNSECDGNFDAILKNQLILFQRANRLTTDGIAGPATITALFK